MSNVQIFSIQPDDVVERAQTNLISGFRLVQMHATTLPDGVEINYTYDLNGEMSVWRLAAAPRSALPSISAVYPAAFLYENEIHDLFDISFSDMSIDYHGNLYRMAVQTPFAPKSPVADASAPAVSAPDVPASAASAQTGSQPVNTQKQTEQEGNNHA